MESLPAEADLNTLEIRASGVEAFVSYIGHPEADGLQQVNAYLPGGLRTGLVRLAVSQGGRQLCEPGVIRMIRPGPPVPRVVSVTDGIDLLSGTRIVTGSVKLAVEEVDHPEGLRIAIGGAAAEEVETFCTDPRLPRHEINFRVPASIGAGASQVEVRDGRRLVGLVAIDVARSS
jgi:hypothetical protein